MNFHEKLNQYIDILNCTAKELSEASGLSPATLSRYRSGERVPEINSDTFNQICKGIAVLLESNCPEKNITEDIVTESFLECPDIIATDKEHFRKKFNTLFSVLDINITKLCQYTNYEVSTLFKIRNGSRNPSNTAKLAADIARYVVREESSAEEKASLIKLIGCSSEEAFDTAKFFECIRDWLIAGQSRPKDDVANFLEKLDTFDLNEYIKLIHFDELKVPSVPFQLPTSKAYFGLKDMMASELDFLKATVLSKSMEPVIMYSDMPMEEMAKDPEFPKKWMFGMAMMLKKGLHLNQIHHLDRAFEEMMLGIESWIPLYMTGQVSPYYLKEVQNNVFMHFLKVSGTAALSGEAISGYHSDGKYYLTKSKDEVAYYKKRAQELLSNALPLMKIYREENADELNAFLAEDLKYEGKRRSILSTPPLHTMDLPLLNKILENNNVSDMEKEKILQFVKKEKDLISEMLKTHVIEDEIPQFTREEFEQYPAVLPLSEIFLEKDIYYSYDEYIEHIHQSEVFQQSHENYTIKKTSTCAFRNLQIHIRESKWAMVSKSKAPAIHFVIHHPKLRNAIENFIPPVVEND